MFVSVAMLASSCFPQLLVSEIGGGENSSSDYDVSIENAEDNSVTSGTADSQRRLKYTLKAGKHEISGVIIAKPLEDGSFRALGATVFGMTVFDMTVSKDSYTMNSCADFLEHKSFASFLASKLRKALY